MKILQSISDKNKIHHMDDLEKGRQETEKESERGRIRASVEAGLAPDDTTWKDLQGRESRRALQDRAVELGLSPDDANWNDIIEAQKKR